MQRMRSLRNTYLFARHGQTGPNVERRYAGGEIDADLTDIGREQARDKLSTRLQGITTVLCSPLRRAVDSAAIALRPHGIPASSFIIDNRLRERRAGAASGMLYDQIAREYPEIWDRTNIPFEQAMRVRFPGGESVQDVADRVDMVIAEAERSYDSRTILCMGHAGVMCAQRLNAEMPQEQVFASIPSCGVDIYTCRNAVLEGGLLVPYA